MAQPKPTAAQALYGHLPSAVRPEVEGPRARNAAEGCWPSLSKEAKAREADQALWDACCKRSRDNFLREWRETNANLRERRR
jgi:hypothetical protein